MKYDVICAGHMCVDMTPAFPVDGETNLKQMFVGGRQLEVGNMAFTTGGSATNTGLGLVKLGVKTALMGKIGGDINGRTLMELLDKQGATTEYLSVAKEENTSYSVVLAVPGNDRIFLHSSAVNDTFTAADINYEVVRNAKLMHFGYPPLMEKMFVSGGTELEKVLMLAKEAGVTTSVDWAYPPPGSLAAQQDWREILEKTLPYTDIFTPSLEELLLLLETPLYHELKSKNDDILEVFDVDYLPVLGKLLVDAGAKIVVIKCGTLGYYVKTAGAKALSHLGRAKPGKVSEWADKEVLSGIYTVDHVVSATGAGDTSIAGFLTAFLKGASLERAVDMACATGAVCTTAFGAVDAIVPYEEIENKVDSGWPKRETNYKTSYFIKNETINMHQKK